MGAGVLQTLWRRCGVEILGRAWLTSSADSLMNMSPGSCGVLPCDRRREQARYLNSEFRNAFLSATMSLNSSHDMVVIVSLIRCLCVQCVTSRGTSRDDILREGGLLFVYSCCARIKKVCSYLRASPAQPTHNQLCRALRGG